MFDVINISMFHVHMFPYLFLFPVFTGLSSNPCQHNRHYSLVSPALPLYSASALANSWNSKLKAGEFPECQPGECSTLM